VAPLERALVWAIRRADVVAVMGSGARRDLIARGAKPERVAVVPASVDEARFGAERPAEPRYDLVTASQLIPRKRLEDLLEATALLREGRPGVRVAIAGRGALEDELRARARALGVQDNVEFLGFVSDVERLYADARVFVLPSRSEGLSIAMCEAMAVGIPVVSTDVGEARDVVVPGETGELVEVGDVPALARYAGELLDDDARRAAMGRAAPAAVRAHCSRERVREINRALLR
jgi:glycosyltransferase involved in cell wall biosynthesis